MIKVEYMLNKLSQSSFRSRFHLNHKMKSYVYDKGFDIVEGHAYDFINSRLRMANPKNDGKQTPMRQVHPVFIAQHACACCCRGCLEKWYHIPKNRNLTDEEVDFLVAVLMKWIMNEIKSL